MAVRDLSHTSKKVIQEKVNAFPSPMAMSLAKASAFGMFVLGCIWWFVKTDYVNEGLLPAKAHQLNDVKDGVARLDERLKGFSAQTDRRLENLQGDVHTHGEQLSAVRAAQERTNSTLDALTSAMLRAPTVIPSHRQQPHAEPTKAASGDH
jgi:hypothetical protein